MGRRVLIIDDDMKVVVPMIKGSLEAKGHVVAATSEWVEVMPLLKSFNPDVVLVDLRMPGISGEAVAGTIKRFNKTTVVLLHSAAPDTELVDACVRCKADGYVKKGDTGDLFRRLEPGAGSGGFPVLGPPK
jgi:CheY-like chemotaxis protein